MKYNTIFFGIKMYASFPPENLHQGIISCLFFFTEPNMVHEIEQIIKYIIIKLIHMFIHLSYMS